MRAQALKRKIAPMSHDDETTATEPSPKKPRVMIKTKSGAAPVGWSPLTVPGAALTVSGTLDRAPFADTRFVKLMTRVGGGNEHAADKIQCALVQLRAGPLPVVAKFLSVQQRGKAHRFADRVDHIRAECAASVAMGALHEKRVTPGTAVLYAAVASESALGLPDGETPWRDVQRQLRLDARPLERSDGKDEAAGEDKAFHCALLSEHIEGGLARYAIDNAYSHFGLSASHTVVSLYGQLQWTLAAIHGAGLVHADAHIDNMLLRFVPAAPQQRFQLKHGPDTIAAEYAFLAVPEHEMSRTVPLLKLIDYGLTEDAGTELCYAPTAYTMRAPEFFACLNPRRPLANYASRPHMRLHAGVDTWSAALSFITLMCKGIMPGRAERSVTHHRVDYGSYSRMPALASADDDFVPSACADEAAWRPHPDFVDGVATLIGVWDDMRRLDPLSICADELAVARQDSPNDIAAYLWRTAMLLGLPTEAQWPGVAQMPLMNLLKAYADTAQFGAAPDDHEVLAPRLARIVDDAIERYVSDMTLAQGRALKMLLARQLQWNPARRAPAHTLLATPVFARLAHSQGLHPAAPTSAGDTWTLTIDPADGAMLPRPPTHCRLHVQ